jgi:hypothetical protein
MALWALARPFDVRTLSPRGDAAKIGGWLISFKEIVFSPSARESFAV